MDSFIDPEYQLQISFQVFLCFFQLLLIQVRIKVTDGYVLFLIGFRLTIRGSIADQYLFKGGQNSVYEAIIRPISRKNNLREILTLKPNLLHLAGVYHKELSPMDILLCQTILDWNISHGRAIGHLISRAILLLPPL